MISIEQAVQAATRLHVLKFYPSDSTGVFDSEVARLLTRMVDTAAQLNWLVAAMIDRVGEWQGPKELRGVFCTRFRPADGIEADCMTTAGFTPGDNEMRSIEAHEERKRQELQPPREMLRLLGVAELKSIDDVPVTEPEWKRRENEERRKRQLLEAAPAIDKKEITQDDIEHAVAMYRMSKKGEVRE